MLLTFCSQDFTSFECLARGQLFKDMGLTKQARAINNAYCSRSFTLESYTSPCITVHAYLFMLLRDIMKRLF